MIAAPSLRLHLTRALGLDAERQTERLLRALLAAAVLGSAALVLANFVIAPLTGHFAGWFEDFGPILYAGHAANTGGDIYGAFVPNSRDSLVTNLGFDYLPLVAWFARPLAAMSHDVAVVIWLWIVLGCIISGSVIIAREVLPASWPRGQIGFATAVLFQPVIYNAWHGQMNAVVFLLLALALRAWMRDDEIGCGLALGLGAACKVSPIVLVLLLVRRGWWRGAAAAVGTLAASLLAGGLLVGFNRVHEWFTQVLPVLERDDGYYFNQSWNAVVNRVADHNVWHLEPGSALLHGAVVALSAGSLLAVAWTVRPGTASRDRRSLEFAAAVVAMVLAATVSWYSAYIYLALPLLVVAGLAARRGVDRAVMLSAVGLVLVAGIVAPLVLGSGAKDWAVSTHGTLMWWPALQLISLPALSAAALLLALWRNLLPARRVGTPARG